MEHLGKAIVAMFWLAVVGAILGTAVLIAAFIYLISLLV